MAYFLSPGSYAEVRLVNAGDLIRSPADLTSAEIATVLTKGLTAWAALNGFHQLTTGEKILVQAVKDALGVDWKIRCEVGGAAPAAEPESVIQPPAQQPDDDEEDMLAEAGSDPSEVSRRDPEEAALELLQSELGARRIDGS